MNIVQGMTQEPVMTVVSNDSSNVIKRSDKISEIAKSLLKVQSEIPTIAKDANNPFFKSKYATFPHIWEECQPVFAKHGIVVSQSSGGAVKVGNDTFVQFETLLIHADSGEWLSSVSLIPLGSKPDPQGYGSCNTYSRRYCLAPLIGIVVDDDDDGNTASQRGQKTYQKQDESMSAKLKKRLHLEAGCNDAKDVDAVLEHIAPGNTLKSIEDEKRAAAVMKIIDEGIRDKTLNLSQVLEDTKTQNAAAEAANSFPA